MKEDNKVTTDQNTNKPKWTGFFIYLAILLIGVIALYPILYDQSVILIDLYELDQFSPQLVTWLNMIQPFLIGTGALLIGHFLAYRVHLDSLIYKKVNEKEPIKESLKRSLLPALIGGVIIGSVIIGFDLLFRSYLPEMLQLPVSMPTVSRSLSSILYGGISEEIMLRFGLMSAAVYVFSLKGHYLNKWVYIGGIVFSAILFALGHYGTTASYFEMTAIMWVRMLLLNGAGGLVFGWLFWKYHLEAAILSHMLTHVTMIILSVILATAGI